MTTQAHIEGLQREVRELSVKLAALKAEIEKPAHEVMDKDRRELAGAAAEAIDRINWDLSPQGFPFFMPIYEHLRAIERGEDCTKLPMPVAKWVKS